MTKPNVLHIAESFGGGTLTAIVQICKTTIHAVNHSVVYSVRSETPADVASLFPASVLLTEIAMCREISPAKDWAALRALVGIIRAQKPDVVHVHSAKAGVLGRLAAWWCGVPVVYTPHGYAFLHVDISPLKRGIYWALEWIVARFGSLTAACGQSEAGYARRFGPTMVVCNGIDLAGLCTSCSTERLPLMEKEQGDAERTVPPTAVVPPVRAGICGRIASPRNPALFARLAARTAGLLQWVWIGGGDPELRQLLHNVEVTGWVSREEAIHHMRGLDIYVQTSLWEGLPFSVMEAMGLGLPVVATDIIGNRELVEHGKTGFLASDEEGLVQALTQLATDAELRARMGARGKARVAEHYDSNVTMKRYADIYKRLAHAS